VRFLIDQDVYALTSRFLKGLGHDVVAAAELGLSQAPDGDLLTRAVHENRLFVTRDKDFGALVFVGRLGKGGNLPAHDSIHPASHARGVEKDPSDPW
jgi:predicted nuclease of predicted toxin-antitoxin system